MSENQFFEKKGPFPLKEIIKTIGCNEVIFIKKMILKYMVLNL